MFNIFTYPETLSRLGSNKDFRDGLLLKSAIKKIAQIVLIMSKDDFEKQWNDSESTIRQFCTSFDIHKPTIWDYSSEFSKNPRLICSQDPFSMLLVNNSDVAKLFRDYLGFWAANPKDMKDDFFYLDHSMLFARGEIIEGPTDNGWGNYLYQIRNNIPPCNTFVFNDRHLLFQNNQRNIERGVKFGLNNLRRLLGEIMPQELKMMVFHILVYCQHPSLDIETTNNHLIQFTKDIKQLRSYPIEVEFVFDRACHQRNLISNYFYFNPERGFNAFNNRNPTQLSGENDFKFKSYLNNPLASGDSDFLIYQKKLHEIISCCKKVIIQPDLEPSSGKLEDIKRAFTSSDDFFTNRFFNNSCSLEVNG